MEQTKQKKAGRKRGTLGWVMEFAGRKRAYFLGSVILAILGVAASLVPYLIIARIVEQLLAGNREWKYYLTQVARRLRTLDRKDQETEIGRAHV